MQTINVNTSWYSPQAEVFYLPAEVERLGLSPEAFRLYVHIARLCSRGFVSFAPAAPAWVDIAARCQLSMEGLSAALHELQGHNLVMLEDKGEEKAKQNGC